MLLLTTLFFVFVNAELSNHNDCDDDHCPICETIYIVKKSIKHLSLGSGEITLMLFIALYLYYKCKINIVDDLYCDTLIKNKVRLDC